jgi:hypothetical protein
MSPRSSLAWFTLGLGLACSDDEGSAADRIGVGAECSTSSPCPKARRGEEEVQLACLAAFRGGYCGIADCQSDADCPDGSACVNHEGGARYCFRTCVEKAECNRNRTTENEANCSANVDFIAAEGVKACVPPSSG